MQASDIAERGREFKLNLDAERWTTWEIFCVVYGLHPTRKVHWEKVGSCYYLRGTKGYVELVDGVWYGHAFHNIKTSVDPGTYTFKFVELPIRVFDVLEDARRYVAGNSCPDGSM